MAWVSMTPTRSSRSCRNRGPDCLDESGPRLGFAPECVRRHHQPRKIDETAGVAAGRPDLPVKRAARRRRRQSPGGASRSVPRRPRANRTGRLPGAGGLHPVGARRARPPQGAGGVPIGRARATARLIPARRGGRRPRPPSRPEQQDWTHRSGREQARRGVLHAATVHRQMPGRTRERKLAWRLRWRSKAGSRRHF